MTSPSPETVAREADKLFLTDAEMIRWLGVPEKEMRRVLDNRSHTDELQAVDRKGLSQ
jgi:hypothetical protein